MTASSRRPVSQSINSAGGTMSANWRLARLRHLPSEPRASQTTISARPTSFNAATTFDPLKPAPPVTSNIPLPDSVRWPGDCLEARWDWVESPSRSRFLIEHDLFGKPLRTFPDHALAHGSAKCKRFGEDRSLSSP